jgi:hypothetical protein
MNEERLQKLTQRIAVDVFNLWWEHRKRDFGFQHVTGCLPAIAQSNPTSVIPVILERLRDEDSWVRERAAAALGQMSEAAAQQPEVVPTLVAWLRDEDWRVRGSAAAALEKMMAQGTRVFKGRLGKLAARSVAELSR